MKRHRLLALTFLGCLVVFVSLLTSPHAPLYDGVGAPDEPYRYVSPPKASLKTKNPPTEARVSSLMNVDGNINAVSFTSDEIGPQVNIYLAPGALQAATHPPSGQLTILATPETPSGSEPKVGTIVGNVYRFSATSDKGAVTYVGNNATGSYVYLRLPQGYPIGATIVYRTTSNNTWATQNTIRTGNDIYSAKIAGLGEYAIVSTPSDATTKQSHTYGILLLAVMLVGILAVIVYIRFRSARQKHHAG